MQSHSSGQLGIQHMNVGVGGVGGREHTSACSSISSLHYKGLFIDLIWIH